MPDMRGVLRSPYLDAVFGEARYDAYLPKRPTYRIEAGIEALATEAFNIIAPAKEDYSLHRLPGPESWERWLRKLRSSGPDDKVVQIGLAGLTYAQHELRHHIDYACTPVLTSIVNALHQEYGYVTRLARCNVGSAEFHELVLRLRRHHRIRRSNWGLITTYVPEEWVNPPLIEFALRFGVFRIRRSGIEQFQNDAVVTLSLKSGSERVVSLHTILETRAMVESALRMYGSLRQIGATQEEMRLALEILLTIGIDRSRDDYWTLIEIVSAYAGDENPVDGLHEKSGEMLFSGWLALHGLPPREGTSGDVNMEPARLLILTLQKVMQYSDRGIDASKWDFVLATIWREIAERIDIPWMSLDDVLKHSYQVSYSLLQQLEGRNQHVTGLASKHMRYLCMVSLAGIDARLEDGPSWIDVYAGGVNFDPFGASDFDDDPPSDVVSAHRLLNRFRNLLYQDSAHESLVQAARDLTTDE